MRKRESVLVGVWERERVCLWVCGKKRKSVLVGGWVCGKERESVRVREREKSE